MVITDWNGHLSTCQTWILLRWSINYDALQRRNDFNSGDTINNIARVSDFMDLRSMLFCTSIIEIITHLRIGPTRMALVQRIPFWYDSTFIHSRRYQSEFDFLLLFRFILPKSYVNDLLKIFFHFTGIIWWIAATLFGYLSPRCMANLCRRVNTIYIQFSSFVKTDFG